MKKNLTIGILPKKIEEIIRKELKKRTTDSFHKFANGWISTSKSDPIKGSIYYKIKNGPIIQFVDKYKKIHVGILNEICYEKDSNSYDGVVVCYERTNKYSFSEPDKNGIISAKGIGKEMDFNNYGIDIDNISNLKFPPFKIK